MPCHSFCKISPYKLSKNQIVWFTPSKTGSQNGFNTQYIFFSSVYSATHCSKNWEYTGEKKNNTQQRPCFHGAYTDMGRGLFILNFNSSYHRLSVFFSFSLQIKKNLDCHLLLNVFLFQTIFFSAYYYYVWQYLTKFYIHL